jgi:hypothetical protein
MTSSEETSAAQHHISETINAITSTATTITKILKDAHYPLSDAIRTTLYAAYTAHWKYTAILETAAATGIALNDNPLIIEYQAHYAIKMQTHTDTCLRCNPHAYACAYCNPDLIIYTYDGREVRVPNAHDKPDHDGRFGYFKLHEMYYHQHFILNKSKLSCAWMHYEINHEFTQYITLLENIISHTHATQ